jgi:hypothetical protein
LTYRQELSFPLFYVQTSYGRDLLVLLPPAADRSPVFSELLAAICRETGPPPLVQLRAGQLGRLLRLVPGGGELEEAAFVLDYLRAAVSCSPSRLAQV